MTTTHADPHVGAESIDELDPEPVLAKSAAIFRAMTLSGTTTAADILRCFDVLRRDLANDTYGTAGAFSGYESLHLVPTPNGSREGELIVSAFVTAQTCKTQKVRFCAFQAPEGRGREEGERYLVAHGIGHTVAVDNTSRPEPRDLA